MTLGVLALSLVAASTPVQEASPFVGTAGHGHAFPGATAPFGMVQLSPDTTRTDTWDGCSGYHWDDKRINGFSHTHLSGTGVGGLGDIMVMPFSGTPGEKSDVSSAFSHDRESAQPGYYSVYLQDPKVQAELTATTRAGLHHYTFEGAGDHSLVIDLDHGVQNETLDALLTVEDHQTISGWRKSRGWGGERTCYFVMRFSKPIGGVDPGAIRMFGAPKIEGRSFRGKLRTFIPVPADIEVKVGISATGVEGARKNLSAEIPGWDFNAVRAKTQKTWNDVLGATTIEARDAKIRRTFYSNLYLAYQAPNTFNDVDGAYWGTDHKVHTGAKFTNYSTFSLWDTYRSLHPLLTLLQPERVDDMVASLVAEHEESGINTMPVWPLWGNETYTMVGMSSVPVICEAYLKGYRGFDAEKAYEAMKASMLGTYRGLDSMNRLGWVASRRGQEASSKTVEYGYDFWCLARMADAMGKKEDAEMLYAKSEGYRNLFDRSTMLLRGRKDDGSWRKPFDQLGLVGDEYTEADAWQYTLGGPQDVDGLIALYGGDAGFVKRLDTMFTMTSDVHTGIPDITGRIGQYAHGNEPCHHVAYLYDYAGAPAKTAMRVREVMAKLYGDGPADEVGNVDCGQMAAWYVWSAMGLYPVNASSGQVMIGSPVVDRATIRVGKNRFTVEAVGNSATNLYVQSAMLDGRSWDRPWITDAQIRAGGTLRLVMGPTPSAWGTSLASRPPSTMPKSFQYAALPAPASTDDRPVTLALPIRIASGGTDEPVMGFIEDPNAIDGSTNGTRGRVDVSAPGAGPEAIYLTERYGPDFSQRFAVAAGTYTVKLHFAEVFGDEPGQRVENVSINGRRVLERFDPIVAAGGPMRAVVKTFTGIKPNEKGEIVVRVQAEPGAPDQNAKISGIEILP